MLDFERIRNIFPKEIGGESKFYKYIVREYLQLMILDYLFYTPFYNKVVLIGGANLRIIQEIDRFTEDIDFDCRNLSREDFVSMTNDIALYLKNRDIYVETIENTKLNMKAFERILYFPHLQLCRDAISDDIISFKLKIQAQDQGVSYKPDRAYVDKDIFRFYVNIPPLDVLCAMKLISILMRNSSSDYYDIPFLLSKTPPNIDFVKVKLGITSQEILKRLLIERLRNVDLEKKKKWIDRLLFNGASADRISKIRQVIGSM